MKGDQRTGRAELPKRTARLCFCLTVSLTLLPPVLFGNVFISTNKYTSGKERRIFSDHRDKRGWATLALSSPASRQLASDSTPATQHRAPVRGPRAAACHRPRRAEPLTPPTGPLGRRSRSVWFGTLSNLKKRSLSQRPVQLGLALWF